MSEVTWLSCRGRSVQAVTGLGCRGGDLHGPDAVSGVLLPGCPLPLQLRCTAVGQVDNLGEHGERGMRLTKQGTRHRRQGGEA